MSVERVDEAIAVLARRRVVLVSTEREDAGEALLVIAPEAVDDPPVAFKAWGDSTSIRTVHEGRGPGRVHASERWPSHALGPGGVLANPGCEEAAVDLIRLAGFAPAALVCELSARKLRSGASILDFAAQRSLPHVTVDEVATFRWRTEALVERLSEASLPTSFADFVAVGYVAKISRSEHIALVLGDVSGGRGVLVRVHSACLTGDVFSSLRCDCGDQLRLSMQMIAEAGEGIIVYDPTHEGRGTGLVDKLAAYRLQELGLDTAEANLRIGHAVDSRHYGVDAQIILDLKVSSVNLLTNNPDKVAQLSRFGVEVSERVPLWTGRNTHNEFYLDTKIERLGHLRGGA